MKLNVILSIVVAILAAFVLFLSWQGKEVYEALVALVLVIFAGYLLRLPIQ